MNGVHDLGGMDGFGPIEPEADEPRFHADWEKRVFGLFGTTMALRAYNLDEFRHAIERMAPAEYLTSSYYEHWLHAFDTLLVEKGVLTAEEIDSGRASGGRVGEPPMTPEVAQALIDNGGSTRIDADVPPRFAVGDHVVARNDHPRGHTRMPRYVRGHTGEVIRDHGVFVFPDTHAHGGGAKPQRVYNVRFMRSELFGADVPAGDSIVVDLWDDHLEPA